MIQCGFGIAMNQLGKIRDRVLYPTTDATKEVARNVKNRSVVLHSNLACSKSVGALFFHLYDIIFTITAKLPA